MRRTFNKEIQGRWEGGTIGRTPLLYYLAGDQSCALNIRQRDENILTWGAGGCAVVVGKRKGYVEEPSSRVYSIGARHLASWAACVGTRGLAERSAEHCCYVRFGTDPCQSEASIIVPI